VVKLSLYLYIETTSLCGSKTKESGIGRFE
jgi:hypothetical protein